MLEWVCPRCRRAVDPGFSACPFCGYSSEAAQRSATEAPQTASPVLRPARAGFNWADVERGFRFGLGLVAALAAAYFVLFLIAYFGDLPEWADRLAHWLRLR